MKISLRHFDNNDYDFISQKLFPAMTIDEIGVMVKEGCDILKYEGSYFEMFAVEADSRLAGYISLYEREKNSVNIGVTIIPEYQRKDIAFKAISVVLCYVKESGYKKIYARVLKDNKASLKLCEKLELCIIGEDITADKKEVYNLEKILMKTDALIILDGYGLSDQKEGNAIAAAKTPFLDYLSKNYPSSRLLASGLDVGLPAGQMGNSEVGHLNIGAGRIVYQDITAIDKAIEDGDFFANPAFVSAMQNAKNSELHLAGLCSDGGVHSHLNHLYALLKMAKTGGVKNVYIHCVMDGRDTPPKSGEGYLAQIEEKCAAIGVGKIATVVGRFYYMDRDNRWERVEKGYNCVFCGEGQPFATAKEAVAAAYAKGESDEFICPLIIGGYKGFKKGGSFIFFNFRADRAREITRAVIEPDFNQFNRKTGFLAPVYVGMTQYDAGFTGLLTAYPPKNLKDTLGEYLSANGKTQARVAETEKYAHVTFFFNGGVEKPNDNEQRHLIPSPKVATYDLKPEMSAHEVASKAVEVVGSVDALIVNFANCDMVGHTGVFDATVAAVETVDAELKRVVEAVLKTGGTALITSDHGNADTMLEKDGTVITAHSVNPVPLWIAGEKYKNAELKDGKLCDLAPTLLQVMGLKKPAAMTGESLIK